jgi:hypothetical protein
MSFAASLLEGLRCILITADFEAKPADSEIRIGFLPVR